MIKLAAAAAALTLLAGGSPSQPPAGPSADYQAGKRAAKEGRLDAAFLSYEAAAKEGVIGAQLELARIHASGVGGLRNDKRAFGLYKVLADQFFELEAGHPLTFVAAEACRAIGIYYRAGVAEAQVEANPSQAAWYLHQAGGYYHDAVAQHQLGELYQSGDGVAKLPAIARTWFENSARKRYAPGQAALGEMLWRGVEVKRKPAAGLAWLALASVNALPSQRQVIDALYVNALNEADNKTIETANALLKELTPAYSIARGDVRAVPPPVLKPDGSMSPEAPALIASGEPSAAAAETSSAGARDAAMEGIIKVPSAFSLDGKPGSQ